MKTKRLFLPFKFTYLIIFAFLFSHLSSQNECGTIVPENYKYPKNFKQRCINPDVTLNMQLLVIQDENGNNGISPNQVIMIKDELDFAFNKYGIYFDYCTAYVKDNELLLNPDTDHFYVQDNMINLALYSNSGNASSGGMGGVGSNSAWVSISAGIKAASHEVGHLFGLLHTFQTFTFDFGNGVLIEIKEQVSRDASNADTYIHPDDPTMMYIDEPLSCYNCEIYGDKLCSTPADPGGGDVQDFCNAVPIATDNCGSSYTDMLDADGLGVLEHNYMDYNNQTCQSTFSWEQVNLMHATINSNHSDKISDGSQDNFDYSNVIDSEGTYIGSTPFEEFIILEDLEITGDLNIENIDLKIVKGKKNSN